MGALLRYVAVLSIVLLIGCGSSPVADDLSQRDANRIVSVLRGKGIESTTEKERGARGRYTVVVSSTDFAKAASHLAELGLPEERQASFSELVAQSGFLPSSKDVEALRLDRAVAVEIEELLRGHPAVAEAHVVVRHHALSDGAPPTISCMVQKHTGSAASGDELRGVIARALPFVHTEDIVVTVAEQRVSQPSESGSVDAAQATVPFLVFWRVPLTEYNGLAWLLIGLLVFVASLAGLGGYIFGQYTLTKQHVLGRGERVDARAVVAKPVSSTEIEQKEDHE